MTRTLTHIHFATGFAVVPAGASIRTAGTAGFTGAKHPAMPARRFVNPHALAQRSAP